MQNLFSMYVNGSKAKQIYFRLQRTESARSFQGTEGWQMGTGTMLLNIFIVNQIYFLTFDELLSLFILDTGLSGVCCWSLHPSFALRVLYHKSVMMVALGTIGWKRQPEMAFYTIHLLFLPSVLLDHWWAPHFYYFFFLLVSVLRLKPRASCKQSK